MITFGRGGFFTLFGRALLRSTQQSDLTHPQGPSRLACRYRTVQHIDRSDECAHEHWLDLDRNDVEAWTPKLENLLPREIVQPFVASLERLVPDPQDPVWVWADMGEKLAREAEGLSV